MIKLSELRTIKEVSAFKEMRVRWIAKRDNLDMYAMKDGTVKVWCKNPMPAGIPTYVELQPAVIELIVPAEIPAPPLPGAVK